MNVISRILFEEQPLIVRPTLKKTFGTNEALFIQQLHNLLLISQTIYKEKQWVAKTYSEWAENLAMNSVETTRKTILKLEKKGIVVSATPNIKNWDRTKWYRLDYNRLNEIVNSYLNTKI